MQFLFVKPRRIVIFILVILFLTYNPQFCFSKDSLNLSGKYKGCNVILIILDALRPDYLSCYGHSIKTSPNIDLLAQNGIIFKNAFSQSNLTLPSVTSLFTSLYPISHKAVYVFKDKVPQSVYTLAQILNLYGYKTAWCGSLQDPHTGGAESTLKGFSEKFDLFPETNIKRNSLLISDWIRDHKSSPFFLTIHSYIAHDMFFPYVKFNNELQVFFREPLDFIYASQLRWWEQMQNTLRNNPEDFYKLFGKDWVQKYKEYFMQPLSDENIRKINGLAINEQQKMTLNILLQNSYHLFFNSFDKNQLREFFSRLNSAIFALDKMIIGELINELKQSNLYDKTMIIITSAHGNEYNEHGGIGHGKRLFDESIRVPLVFYVPNLIRAVRIEELVQGIDVLPTVLDLLNIPIPHQAQGISLVGLMEGKKNALTNEYVFSQALGSFLSIRSKQWKLIRKFKEDWIDLKPWEGLKNWDDSIQEWLFDLKKDKGEKNNLINRKPEVAEDLRQRLESKLNSLVVYQEGESEFVEGLPEGIKERIIKTGYW
jgi:arylsulfatase A-like enzyme